MEHPDTLEEISNPQVRSMMLEIREIRKTPPGTGSGLSDRELLAEAYTRIADEKGPRESGAPLPRATAFRPATRRG